MPGLADRLDTALTIVSNWLKTWYNWYHERSTAAAPAFPDDGVTLAFLRRFLLDPRLQQPMVTLPLVCPATKALLPPPTTAELAGFDISELLALCRRYRVFSHLDSTDEFGRYDGDVLVGRDELLAALHRPPTTTTQVCDCLVKPDTLGTGCSYARMLVARGDGDGMVGRPTVFVSHAWRVSPPSSGFFGRAFWATPHGIAHCSCKSSFVKAAMLLHICACLSLTLVAPILFNGL